MLEDANFRCTYTVDTGRTVFKVTAWGNHDIMAVGTRQEIPVSATAFVSNEGNALVQFTLPTTMLTSGEETF